MILQSAILLFSLAVAGHAFIAPADAEDASREGEVKTLRIIATSDMHGKFMPWDYALDEEDSSGSITQLATAIAEYRTDATLLVDAAISYRITAPTSSSIRLRMYTLWCRHSMRSAMTSG